MSSSTHSESTKTDSNSRPPSTVLVVLNFLSAYFVWGSTYLAIKFAVAAFPPLFMASARFALAGLILLAIGRFRKETSLKPKDRRLAVLSGTLLATANGLVCVAEQSLPSGLVAVLIGTIPAWISIYHWKLFAGTPPNLKQLVGIGISLCGIAFLIQRETLNSDLHRALGVLALLGSVNLWSFGTLIQRKSEAAKNIFTFTGTQLSGGSSILLLIGLLFEGPKALTQIQFQPQAVGAFVYLVLFGSVVAFSSYIWLNRYVNPTKVSTYAVVNPIVAVWIGWLFGNEAITSTTLISTAMILVGIYFVIFDRRKPAP